MPPRLLLLQWPLPLLFLVRLVERVGASTPAKNLREAKEKVVKRPNRALLIFI
jgi:hypothetical protein